MTRDELQSLLQRQPFTPLRLGLSDGRSVLIRHPDQTVVSSRHLYVGLATVGVSAPLVTPGPNEDSRTAILLDYRHIVSAEPQEDAA